MAIGEARWGWRLGRKGEYWEQVYDVIDAAEQQLQSHHCYNHLNACYVKDKAMGKQKSPRSTGCVTVWQASYQTRWRIVSCRYLPIVTVSRSRRDVHSRS